MAYVRLAKLENNSHLDDLTDLEESQANPFYVEDIIRVMSQTGFTSIQKKMATFWGERKQVWVGYNGTTVLGDVIALPCPPYYPPYTTREVDISDVEKPLGFPN